MAAFYGHGWNLLFPSALSELCPFHNGVNASNRQGPFGYIDNPNARIHWIAPNGVTVPMDTPGAMELLFD